MTAADKSHPGDNTHLPCEEEVERGGHDRRECADIPGVAPSHCDGECHADGEGSDCEPSVHPCEESCCGHHEGYSIQEESVHEKDPQGTEPFGSCVLVN